MVRSRCSKSLSRSQCAQDPWSGGRLPDYSQGWGALTSYPHPAGVCSLSGSGGRLVAQAGVEAPAS